MTTTKMQLIAEARVNTTVYQWLGMEVDGLPTVVAYQEGHDGVWAKLGVTTSDDLTDFDGNRYDLEALLERVVGSWLRVSAEGGHSVERYR